MVTSLHAHVTSRRKILHSHSPGEEKGDSEKLSSLPKLSELVTAVNLGFEPMPVPSGIPSHLPEHRGKQ